MKLASLNDGSRDGQLVVVSRDLSLVHYATGIATRMQQLLDDWGFVSPQLEDLYTQLNHGKLRHAFAFDPRLCMAPLPRAPLFAVDGVCAAGDGASGACEVARFPDASLGIAGEAGLVAVLGDVPRGAAPAVALEGVRLLGLLQHWQLREWPDAQPPVAFAPVFVTPDELGPAWTKGRVELPILCNRNGRRGADVRVEERLGPAIERLARARRLGAGALIALSAATAAGDPFQFGDSVRIEVRGEDGQSVFGAIEQEIAGWHHVQEDRGGSTDA